MSSGYEVKAIHFPNEHNVTCSQQKFAVGLLLAWALVASAPRQVLAEDSADRPVFRVVFFSPSDVEPPEDARERLKEYIDYSQMFFGKWMTHWGYETDNALAVIRDEHDLPEILFVKGRHTQASGHYRQLGFQGEVVETACRKYKLDPEGQVWWIFTYKGPESRGFRGGGNAKRGGTSTSIYDPNDNGHLRLDDQLGSDEQARIKSPMTARFKSRSKNSINPMASCELSAASITEPLWAGMLALDCSLDLQSSIDSAMGCLHSMMDGRLVRPHDAGAVLAAVDPMVRGVQ